MTHFIEASQSDSFILDAGRFDLPHLLEKNPHCTDIVISHFHPDHIYGLLNLSWSKGKHMTVFIPPDQEGYADLLTRKSILRFVEVEAFQSFHINNFTITPLPLQHSILTYGYAIEHSNRKLAYLSDTCGLSRETHDFLKKWKPHTAIIDANQTPDNPKPSHNTVCQAIDIAKNLHIEQTYLTHLSCSVEQWILDHGLPKPILLAKDDLNITI